MLLVEPSVLLGDVGAAVVVVVEVDAFVVDVSLNLSSFTVSCNLWMSTILPESCSTFSCSFTKGLGVRVGLGDFCKGRKCGSVSL